MFSKSGLRIVFCALISITVGCGLKTGEENKTTHLAEVKGVSCLTNALDNVKLFVEGTATDEQVGTAAECLQKVVLTFKDNIRGKDKNSYTPDELANFLTTNFIKDGTSFSPSLLREVMKFKVLLFGGTTEVIQKTEVEALSNFIARFKPEIVRLNPHAKVIFSKWVMESDADPAARESRFKAAQAATDKFLQFFGSIIAETGRSYEVEDLTSLLKEIAKFAGSKSEVVTTIENLKLFILKTKLILIGGTSAIQGQEWVTFHHTLAQLYFQNLRVKYFITPLKPDQQDEKLSAIQKIADDVTNLIPELLDAKGGGLVKNSDIVELLDAAKALAPDLKINAELINQVGKLKLVLLGKYENGWESWSKVDFIALNRKLPWIFEQIQVLSKNFKFLKSNTTGFRKNEIKKEDFLAAEKAVVASVKSISENIKYGYDLADLKLLVINAKDVLKGTLDLPENLDDLLNLAGAAKYTLTGEPGTPLSIANLQLLLNVGIQGYSNFIELNNFAMPFKLEEPEFVAQFGPLVPKLKNTLELELQMKPSHVITTKEITPLVLAAQTAKVLSTHFQKKSLDIGIEAFWTLLLNSPEDRLNGLKLPGFEAKALQNLTIELAYWLVSQQSIAAAFGQKPEYSKEELLSALQGRIESVRSPLVSGSLGELKRLLAAPGLMNFNDKAYLKILTDKAPINGLYHAKDLSNSNLSRALARLVIRAVAKDADRVAKLTGVTLDEIQFGFDQLKYLIYDLDLIDPNNPNFISGRFREANLFLAPSNGDEYASFEEFHHLVLHILSGIQRADSLKVLELQKCVKVPAKDIELIAQTLFDSDCLMNLYLNETDSFEDIPGFLKIKTDKKADGTPLYTEEQNKTYYMSLLKAAGHIPNEQNTVKLGDANLFPHVVQYIEMIYYTHDKNRDGILQRDEALGAFPIFKGLIQLLAKPFTAVKEEDLPGVFIYLLKYSKPPKTLADKLKFAQFVKDHVCKDAAGADQPCMKDWDIMSTRHDLGKIFNFIADATAALPVTPGNPSTPSTPSSPF